MCLKQIVNEWNRKVGQNGKIFLAILLHAAMQGNAVKRVLLSFSVPFLYKKQIVKSLNDFSSSRLCAKTIGKETLKHDLEKIEKIYLMGTSTKRF